MERNSSVSALIALIPFARTTNDVHVQQRLQDLADYTANRIIYHALYAVNQMSVKTLGTSDKPSHIATVLA